LLPELFDCLKGCRFPLLRPIKLNIPRTEHRIQDQNSCVNRRHISRLIVFIKDLVCYI
jgi:hypothetical protein